MCWQTNACSCQPWTSHLILCASLTEELSPQIAQHPNRFRSEDYPDHPRGIPCPPLFQRPSISSTISNPLTEWLSYFEIGLPRKSYSASRQRKRSQPPIFNSGSW